ncbi:MAG: hypothetical protein RCG15_06475 [Candidatus Rickettsia vulgarisii]
MKRKNGCITLDTPGALKDLPAEKIQVSDTLLGRTEQKIKSTQNPLVV